MKIDDEEKNWRNECILHDGVNIQWKNEKKRTISGMNHRKDEGRKEKKTKRISLNRKQKKWCTIDDLSELIKYERQIMNVSEMIER